MSRVIVITGASAGVGRAVARELAREGARIALLARGRDGLDAAVKEVEAEGGEAIAIPTDVADADAVERAGALTEERFGPIDVWINNAMASIFAPFMEIDAAEFRRVTEVTYLGVVHGTRTALSRMLPRDRGVIVQVGSALAYRGIPLQSAYCGAKHAIQGFVDSMRAELLHERSGVRMSMVQLPALNTPQFGWVEARLPNAPQPVPPIYQPEVAARGIAYVTRHPRRELWVGVPTVATILANRIAPGLLDRYLGRTGYRSQQTDRRIDPDRPSNLWEPVEGDAGAHGTFDHRAHAWSPQLALAMRRGIVTALAVAGGALSLWRFAKR